MRITVRVTPRAGVDRIDGVGAYGELRVRVRAAPADGEANEALLRTVADACGVGRSRVRLERGAAGRLKLLSIDGVSVTDLTERWPGLQTTDG